MFRVYDKQNKRWLRNRMYLAQNNDLCISKRTLFGVEKISLLSDNRYTWHRDIGLYDKNNRLIYEGDICKSEEYNVTGFIAYINEHAAYRLMDVENSAYYPLSAEIAKNIEVIGNTFDNEDLINFIVE